MATLASSSIPLPSTNASPSSVSILRSLFLDWCILSVLFVTEYFVGEHITPYQRKNVDLSDVSLRHPHLPDIVTVPAMLVVAFVLPWVLGFTFWIIAPVSFLSLFQSKGLFRRLGGGNTNANSNGSGPAGTSFVSRYPGFVSLLYFVLAAYEAFTFTLLVTSILKVVAGRPRPYFATICGDSYDVDGNCPSIAAGTTTVSDLSEARKSFPSGHSSFSFSIGVFASMAIYDRIQSSRKSVWIGGDKDKLPASSLYCVGLQMVFVLIPVLCSCLVAISRTIDYHHHFGDIVGGSVLGSAIAVLCYKNRASYFALLMEVDVGSYIPPLSSSPRAPQQYFANGGDSWRGSEDDEIA